MDDRAEEKAPEAKPARAFNVRSLATLVLCTGVVVWAVQTVRESMKPTTRWVKQLRGGNADDRQTAARELAGFGEEELGITVPALIAAMGDAEPPVRAEVAADLGLAGLTALRSEGRQVEAKQIASTLVQAMDDPSPDVRFSAAWALGKFYSLPKETKLPTDLSTIVSKMVPLLNESTIMSRSGGQTILLKIIAREPFDPPATLVDGINNWPSKESRQAAAVVLGSFSKVGQPVISALIKALDDPEPEVRSSAAVGLRRFAPEAAEATPKLVELLADPFIPPPPPITKVVGVAGPGGGSGATTGPEMTDPAVKAALALGAIVRSEIDRGGKLPAEVLEALTRALHTDRQALKDAAEESLRRIGPGAQSAVPALIRELTDSMKTENSNLGATSATLLGDIAPGTDQAGDAIAALTAAIDSADGKRRLAVISALGQFGPAAASLLPRLRLVLEDKTIDRQYASAVQNTADRIEGKTPVDAPRRKGQRRGNSGASPKPAKP